MQHCCCLWQRKYCIDRDGLQAICERRGNAKVFRRFVMLLVLFTSALSLSLATAQPTLAGAIQVSKLPIVRTVKGHTVPDQSRFAGPERLPTNRRMLAIAPSYPINPQYDCWDAPSSGNCNGLDPATVLDGGNRCSNDAVTVISAVAYDSFNGNEDLLVEERWSPHCQTNWTRVTSYMGNRTVSLRTDLFAQSHSSIDYNSSCGSSCTSLWGPMYYAPSEQVNSQGTISITDPRCCFLPNYQLQATARGYN